MKKSYIISFRWDSPERGCAAIIANLTAKQTGTIDNVLTKLNEAGDNGDTLVWWDTPISAAENNHTVKANVDGGLTYTETLQEIATQARYNEPDVHGEYYNAGKGFTVPELEEALKNE
jgi:hypothetical protein